MSAIFEAWKSKGLGAGLCWVHQCNVLVQCTSASTLRLSSLLAWKSRGWERDWWVTSSRDHTRAATFHHHHHLVWNSKIGKYQVLDGEKVMKWKDKFGILLCFICSVFFLTHYYDTQCIIHYVYLVHRIHEHKTNTQLYGLLQWIRLASPGHLNANNI